MSARADPSVAATVAAVQAIPFRLRYGVGLALSDGVREVADQLLVKVTTSDGVEGFGECIPRPAIYGETLAGAAATIERVIGPRLRDVRVTDLQLVSRQLAALAGNPAARAAAELAVLDALGKTLGVPVHRLLGGYADSVPCCAILAHGDPAAIVEEALALRSGAGVRIFKVKVGADVARDIALVQALRSALGDEAVIYADANGRYETHAAARFLHGAAECGLWGLEEPTAAADLDGRRRLAAASPARIVGDETCADPRQAAIEVRDGRATAVSIKIARTAVVASTRIREFCACLGVPVVIGTQADSAVGAFSAAAFAASAEATAEQPAEVLFFRSFAQNIVTSLPEIRDGRFQLSMRPGFGFDVDPDALEECAIR